MFHDLKSNLNQMVWGITKRTRPIRSAPHKNTPHSSYLKSFQRRNVSDEI